MVPQLEQALAQIATKDEARWTAKLGAITAPAALRQDRRLQHQEVALVVVEEEAVVGADQAPQRLLAMLKEVNQELVERNTAPRLTRNSVLNYPISCQTRATVARVVVAREVRDPHRLQAALDPRIRMCRRSPLARDLQLNIHNKG